MFRPARQIELDLIRATGFRRFPPRLREQPCFYPVLKLEYATQITRDWNNKGAQSCYVGYVLRFQVESKFLEAYPVRQVGDVTHREYWIPATDLDAVNEKLVGSIEIVSQFTAGSANSDAQR